MVNRGTWPKGRRRNRRHLVALVVLLAALVTASPVLTVSALADDASAEPGDWLVGHTLTPRDIPGFAAVESLSEGADAVIGGQGLLFDSQRAERAVGSYTRSFFGWATRESIEISLTEMRTAELADGLIDDPSTYAVPGEQTRGIAFLDAVVDGRYKESGAFTVGRVAVIVVITHPDRVDVPSTMLVDLLGRQRALVPASQDLPLVEGLSPGRLQLLLLAAFLSVLVVIAALAEVCSTLLDRGARGTFRRRSLREPGPSTFRGTVEWLPPFLVDLRRSLRRRSLLRSVLWLAVLAGLYYVPISFYASLGIALGAVLVLSLSATALRMRRDTADVDVPAGWRAFLLQAAAAALGLGATWAALQAVLIVSVTLIAVPGDAALRAPFVISALALAAVLRIIAGAVDRAGRRLSARYAGEALRSDTRPEVVFLRSFEDDAISLKARSTSARSLVEQLTWQGHTTLEVQLARMASFEGPVVAVGEPGTRLPPLGAVRVYYPDDQWQDAVRARLQHARAIVLVAARTPGVVWELRRVASLGLLHKLVVVFPPLHHRELERRRTVVLGSLGIDPRSAPPVRSAHGDLVTLGFGPDGMPHYTLVDGRDAASYQSAVVLEFMRLDEQPAASVHAVADWARVPAGPDSWSELLVRHERVGALRRTWRRHGTGIVVTVLAVQQLVHLFTQSLPQPLVPPGMQVARTAGAFTPVEGGGVLSSADDQLYLFDGSGHDTARTTQIDGWVSTTDSDDAGVVLTTQDPAAVLSVTALDVAAVGWSTPSEGYAVDTAVDTTHVAVATAGPNSVRVLDRSSGAVLWSADQGGLPLSVALTGDTLLVSVSETGELVRYDAANGTRLGAARLPVSVSQLHVVSDQVFAVGLEDATVRRLDPVSGEQTGVLSVNGIGFIGYGQRTAQAGVLGSDAALVGIDLTSMSVVQRTPTDSTPELLSWLDGSFYYSLIGDDEVYVLQE